MTQEELEGKIVYDSFVTEVEKLGGLRWKGLLLGHNLERQTATTEKITKNLQTQENQKATTQTLLKVMTDAQAAVPKAPHVPGSDAAKPINKNVALAAGAVGLGGLGFGYYQYQKNQNDQLGRAYPQNG